MGLAQNVVVQMARLLQIVTLLKDDVGGGKQNVDCLGALGVEGILGFFFISYLFFETLMLAANQND